jgi:hypothetical protein
MKKFFIDIAAIILTITLCCSGCATTPQVSFKRDVHPILVEKCEGCHLPPYGEGYRKTMLNMSSYGSLMEGSIYGPVVIPGDSKKSPLNMLVEGRAGNLPQMLRERHKDITDQEIEILQLWVNQGAANN